MAEGNDEYDLSGELLPCEFCEDLFPIDILIEHQSGCMPGELQFPLGEYRSTVPKNVDLKQDVKEKRITESPVSHGLLPENVIFKKKYEEIAEPLSSLTVPLNPVNKDLTNKKDDTKLMVYTTSDKQHENTNVEKTSLKSSIPYGLSNSNNTRERMESKVYEDSSDDDDEYLEDFWQRAEINLQKRKEIYNTVFHN